MTTMGGRHPPEVSSQRNLRRKRCCTSWKVRGPRARAVVPGWRQAPSDRKSTRLNSSHSQISYAVFCLNKTNLLVFLELGGFGGRLDPGKGPKEVGDGSHHRSGPASGIHDTAPRRSSAARVRTFPPSSS